MLCSFSPSSRCSFIVHRFFSKATAGTTVHVFDNNAKRMQRNRAALDPASRDFDFLKVEVGARLADRVLDLKDRHFPRALDFGSGPGYLLPNLSDRIGQEELIMMDRSEKMLYRDQEFDSQYNRKITRIVHDEEKLPFEPESLDLVISNLSMHWINDLPGVLYQIKHALKPDGFMLVSMFGEQSLFELRTSLLLAEQERKGGMAQHLSPYAGVADVGALLTTCKFALPTVDTERIVIRYGDIFALMRDLKGMAENGCATRRQPTIARETLVAANGTNIDNGCSNLNAFYSKAIYHEMFPATNPETNEPEGIEATFNVMYVGAWAPASNQQQPARRGSQKMSFADL